MLREKQEEWAEEEQARARGKVRAAVRDLVRQLLTLDRYRRAPKSRLSRTTTSRSARSGRRKARLRQWIQATKTSSRTTDLS